MKKILKLIIGVILLLVLVIGGFALGVYLQLFDTNELNEELHLYELPVIGEFFVRPNGVHEDEKDGAVMAAVESEKNGPVKKESTTRRLTREEIEKDRQMRLAEEKKRVTKLARVYDQMKPKDAAEVMGNLEDGLAVQILQRMDEGQAAKVLAAMEAGRSAQLTQLLYTGLAPGTNSSRPPAAGNAPQEEEPEGEAEGAVPQP
ncbi:hypothetical protein TAMA11512_06290 [Selenomonas sp. TAMA-11512]|uniref:magnesium transporter MgtE N-terminal domain-containing protein n=1 Tax=Selenomonas sp. TAMA-11512 TaxID=3095337 RepID=UPI00308B9FEE|nr:hypothetical protein TAMA11512_06290 [Selenomonas sp. TAMA-11512]